MAFFFKKKETTQALESFLVPMSGDVQPIEKTPDDAFAQKMMGDGMVIFPTAGEVFAPTNASVEFVFPTKHAIGLKTESGLEYLIHVGIDTVQMNGEGFETFVEAGQQVKAGDLLLKFDLALVSEKAKSTATPLVITNLGEKTFEAKAQGQSEAKEVLLVVR
ncbi:MAG: PTS sugar transporter subunit IIA [Erysipelotrichaceae bacterium]